MGEMRTRITPMELAAEMQVSPERVGQLFRAFRDGKHPHFAGRFNRFAELTPIQVAILRGEDFEVEVLGIEDVTDTEGAEQGPSKETASQGVDYEKLDVYTRWEIMKARHSERMALAEKAVNAIDKPRRWPLWVALVITAGASVPNMVEVTTAMKGSSLVAWAMTAVFTLIPGLLIAARLRGLLWGIVVVGVMGYTAFCNASAIFGGLTALDKGYILQPTVFLEAVTNMLNTDYLNTARYLSALMALLIGAIEFVAFKNLAK